MSLFSLVKRDHDLQEYSLSQSTLENVFVGFAKEQEELLAAKKKKNEGGSKSQGKEETK